MISKFVCKIWPCILEMLEQGGRTTNDEHGYTISSPIERAKTLQRTNDGRTSEHGYTISSPIEPAGTVS